MTAFLKREKPLEHDAIETIIGWGFLILLGLAGYAIFSAYEGGWISHNHDTPVWIAGDWIVGEYRDCGMLTTTPPAGITLSEARQAELPRMFCGKNWEGQGVAEFETAMPNPDDATNTILGRGDWSTFNSFFHVLPVQYYGRTDRPDSVFISWRCQRQSGSLTCKALN